MTNIPGSDFHKKSLVWFKYQFCDTVRNKILNYDNTINSVFLGEEVRTCLGSDNIYHYYDWQKQPIRGVLRKRCPENMQQIYRGTPMLKCDSKKLQSNFIEIAVRHECSPVHLLHIFWTHFPKNTSKRLLRNWRGCL